MQCEEESTEGEEQTPVQCERFATRSRTGEATLKLTGSKQHRR
jgi:hypothetical protein